MHRDTAQNKAQGSRSATLLQVALYVLAALAALCALFALLAGWNAAAALQSSVYLLSAVLGPLADLVIGALRSAAQYVGLLIFVIMAGIGGLLLIAARVVGNQATLAARVARLEALLDAREKPSQDEPQP